MRLGLVGLGRIGRVHLQTLRQSPRVSRLDVVDPLPTGELRPSETHFDAVTSELVGSWDAAVISTPTHTHRDLLKLCWERGIPAFCEKPAGGEVINATRATSRAAVQIGFQRRFDDAYQSIKSAISTGQVGQVRWLRIVTTDMAEPPTSYESGHDILGDQQIHDLDTVAWLLDLGLESVETIGVTWRQPYPSAPMTSTIQLFEPKQGVVVSMFASRASHAGYRAEMEVHGTCASLVLSAKGGIERYEGTAVQTLREGQSSTPRTFEDRYKQAYATEIQHFLKVVEQGRTPTPSLRDCAPALSLLARVREFGVD